MSTSMHALVADRVHAIRMLSPDAGQWTDLRRQQFLSRKK